MNWVEPLSNILFPKPPIIALYPFQVVGSPFEVIIQLATPPFIVLPIPEDADVADKHWQILLLAPPKIELSVAPLPDEIIQLQRPPKIELSLVASWQLVILLERPPPINEL